ncbi:FAD-binding domain-containing protein [Rickettsiales bacterium]|nr:FAD-binding domain-containing protein [Rickettsiales bacterium]
MDKLQTNFKNRSELVSYVKELCPYAEGSASDIKGGLKSGLTKLNKIKPIKYAASRNYGHGDVTHLSPYIHHGILTLNEVRNHALSQCQQPAQITKFIQELGWRDFWQHISDANPNWLYEDVEPYKTGYNANDYQDQLPDDILKGKTGVAAIDNFINELITTGYLHNHARMYLASYIVHFRRIKWQAGAYWFLEHLLDGDEASNNLSWQWVASTFSNKPYIFNLENLSKYFGRIVDCSSENNQIFDKTYQQLNSMLFKRQYD